MKTGRRQTRKAKPVVFLFDVDNTLLNNDRVTQDLGGHLAREVGRAGARRYWAIFEDLRRRLGYADYLGALQRYRVEYPHDLRLLTVSRFLIDYPFATRLYPDSLDVIERAKIWGTAGLLTDGDVVFQPRKVDRRVWARRWPAECCVTCIKSGNWRTWRADFRPGITWWWMTSCAC